MAARKVSDTARQRKRNLQQGYPTALGIIDPGDLDKLHKQPPPKHKEATIRMGGKGRIERVPDEPKRPRRKRNLSLEV